MYRFTDTEDMSELAVITPSFGPDVELFADLHRSVLRYAPGNSLHHVIVPDRDRAVFERFAGPRCHIWLESELLPRRFRRTPKPGMWLNLRRPWPPVRGWVLQQALKIAATGKLDVDAVVIADSDVVLVRDITVDTFTVDGQTRLFRMPDAVHAGMADHIRWHGVARRLLGLPPTPPLPLPDYVSSLNVWVPSHVRTMQQRIESVTGRSWIDAVTSQLHVSEFILYGIFIDEVLSEGGTRPPGDTTICHNSWDRTPMDLETALAFADELGPEAVGMMISAKSRTPHDIRLAAIDRCAEIVAEDGVAR